MELVSFLAIIVAFGAGAEAAPTGALDALLHPFGPLATNTPSSTPAAQPSQTTQAYPQVTHQSGGDEHIVILDSSCPHPELVLGRIGLSSNHSDVKYTYLNSAFQGFAACLPDASINALGDMDDVMHVEQAVNVASLVAQTASTRSEATWGLQRISSSTTVSGDKTALQYSYAYQDTQLGQGVDIYIVDSGIYTQNSAFGGRAAMGFSYESDTSDGDGHGTHVSGTAAGQVFGVASNANLIGVKVLNATGAGSSSDTIAGMNYVVQQHDAKKSSSDFIGSIMSMSWGLSQASQSINTAITAASEQGIHVSVAAGNAGSDACNVSPSQLGGPKAASVISVGSVGESNAISSFSNTGTCVDIYAPGEEVVSAWIGSPNEVNTLSGTSMSTPHVTGVMAYLMAADSSLAQNPAALKSKLISMALKNVVTGTSVNNGQKLLLNNGIMDPTGTEGIL